MAEARLVQAQVDEKYFGMQVLSPEDIAKSRFGDDGYSFDTKIDLKALMQLQAAMQQTPPAAAPGRPGQPGPGGKPPGAAKPGPAADEPQARAGAKPGATE
jgi:hypothetical protein